MLQLPGLNRREFAQSCRDHRLLRNIHDLRWTCVVLVYHVTMETEDICCEHQPEELVTATSARKQMCVYTHAHIYTQTHPEGEAGQESVRRNQSQHSLLSRGFQL